MHRIKYAIESDGPERLEIRWEGGNVYHRRNISVVFDDKVVGDIPNRSELKAGKDFALPDGSIVHVKFTNGEWRVSRNGTLLTQIEHPQRSLQSSSNAFAFMGIVNIIIGLIAASKIVWQDVPFIGLLTMFGTGLAYLLVAQLARRRLSAAFVFGVVVYILQAVVLQMSEGRLSFSLLFGIVHVLGYSVVGIQSIRKLSSRKSPP